MIETAVRVLVAVVWCTGQVTRQVVSEQAAV